MQLGVLSLARRKFFRSIVLTANNFAARSESAFFIAKLLRPAVATGLPANTSVDDANNLLTEGVAKFSGRWAKQFRLRESGKFSNADGGRAMCAQFDPAHRIAGEEVCRLRVIKDQTPRFWQRGWNISQFDTDVQMYFWPREKDCDRGAKFSTAA